MAHMKDVSPHTCSATLDKYDRDGSGSLDTFELSGAIGELLGRAPSTSEVVKMVEASGARNNHLTVAQFASLVRTFDFVAAAAAAAPGFPKPALLAGTFEVTFSEPSFGIQLVSREGKIVVGRVGTGAHVASKLAPGDEVVCINGSPLGAVKTDKELGAKLKALPKVPASLPLKGSLRHRSFADSIPCAVPCAPRCA